MSYFWLIEDHVRLVGVSALSPICEILLPGLVVSAGRDANDRMIMLLLIEPPTGAPSELPLAGEPLGSSRLPGSRKTLDEDELGHVPYNFRCEAFG